LAIGSIIGASFDDFRFYYTIEGEIYQEEFYEKGKMIAKKGRVPLSAQKLAIDKCLKVCYTVFKHNACVRSARVKARLPAPLYAV
jgi:hypothetical protein